jgi:hypothetical protein
VNGLVDVTQIEPISLIFTLPETDFARVQERITQGPLAVIVDNQNGQQLDQGTLNLIDNQAPEGLWRDFYRPFFEDSPLKSTLNNH